MSSGQPESRPAGSGAGVAGPPFDGLIFDLDDTLIRTQIDYEAMRRRLYALCREHLPDARLPEAPAGLRSAEWVALAAAWDRQQGTDVAALLLQAAAVFERRGLEFLRPEPGALATVRRLAEHGVRVAVFTNNSRDNLALALARLELEDIVRPAVSRDDVARLKPAPDGLQRVLTAWPPGVAAAFVGDSVIDATAAREAGVPFIFYRTGAARWRQDVTPPPQTAYVIEHLEELLSLAVGDAAGETGPPVNPPS